MAWFDNQMDADAIVVGAGLAGLTATAELARAGRRVLLLDQEPESNLGGQAFWSFGGLFLVGSPEQRRMGIRDSHALAWQDWMGSAFFDRGIDDPAGEDYCSKGRPPYDANFDTDRLFDDEEPRPRRTNDVERRQRERAKNVSSTSPVVPLASRRRKPPGPAA